MLAYNEVKKSDYIHLMTAGVVLTGGGAMLPGAVDLAEEIFQMPVKLGLPQRIESVSDEVKKPNHATGVGLILYGLENQDLLDGPFGDSESHVFNKILERMRKWFGGA